MLVFLGGAQVAHAAGSQDLWPSGAAGNRANSEWRTNSHGGGPLIRRTLGKAFVQAGEGPLPGSSAIGQGAGDILVWEPGLNPKGTPPEPSPPFISYCRLLL